MSYVGLTGSFVKDCNVKRSWLYVYSGTPMAKAGNIQKLKAFFGETVGSLLFRKIFICIDSIFYVM